MSLRPLQENCEASAAFKGLSVGHTNRRITRTDRCGEHRHQDETLVQKDKLYRNVKFDAQTISEADAALGPKNEYKRLVVGFADSEWSFDSFEEFLAAADKGRPTIWVSTSDGKRSLWANTYDRTTRVQVGGRARNEIESIFSIFEKNAERCQLPEEAK